MSGSPWSGIGKPVIGDSVRALAHKILPKNMAKQHFPEDHATASIEGVVTENKDARKLGIEWKLPNDSVYKSINAKRILLGADQAAPPIFRGVGPPDANVGGVLRGTEEEICLNAGDRLVDPHSEDLEEEMAVPPELSPQEDPLSAPVGNDPLNPHGQLWQEVEGAVAIDKRTEDRWRPKLLWPGEQRRLGGHSRLETFLLMCPDVLEVAVNTFNTTKAINFAVLTVGELMKFLGLCFALGLINLRLRRDFWADPKNQEPWRIFPSPDFGKWGMGVRRFEVIMAGLKWFPLDDDKFPADDKWRCIRYFVFKFNERRGDPILKTFSAGWMLCVDESTIKWRGADGAWHINGCPHVSKIARKPETLSIEIRDLLCTKSGIFLVLEIMEGKEVMSKLPGVKDHGAGTAQLLRLTVNFQGRGFAVAGDSAFASVHAAVQLALVGVYFIGLIKTAHKAFPLKFLKEHKFQARGDTKTLETTRDGVVVYAHSWADPNKPGKPHKHLVSTFGTTLPAEPSLRPRKKFNQQTGDMQDVVLVVPRTHMVAAYFDHAGGIDKSNRTRQDGFRLERAIEVKKWEVRAWMGLWGFVGSDAYHAWKLDGGEGTLSEFIERLAHELITNKYDEEEVAAWRDRGTGVKRGGEGEGRRQGGASKKKKSSEGDEVSAVPRYLWHTPVSVLTCRRDISQVTCRVCGAKCALLCSRCSDLDSGLHYGLCNPSTGRDCMAQHMYSKF